MTDNPLPLGSYSRPAIGGHQWQDASPERNAGGPVAPPGSLAAIDPLARRGGLPAPAPPPPPSPVTTPTIEGETLRRLFGAAWQARHTRDAAIAAAEKAHTRAVNAARDRLLSLAGRHVPAHQIEAAQHAVEQLERMGADPCTDACEAAKQAVAEYSAALKLARGV